jgi:hypothetical protein
MAGQTWMSLTVNRILFSSCTYYNVFMVDSQPVFELLFIKFAELVAGGGIEPSICELMRLTCDHYTFPR